MPGPWEQFQTQPELKPWEKFSTQGAAKPWEKFSAPQSEEPGAFDFKGAMHKEASEGTQQVRESAGSFGGSKKPPSVAGMAGGAFKVLTSPLSAAQSAFIDKPADVAMTKLLGPKDPRAPTGGTDLSTALFGGSTKGLNLPKMGASLIEKILSPTTVSKEAGAAEALIRGKQGEAARSTAQTQAEMEPFHKAVNAMPEIDRLSFIDFVENRSLGKSLFDPSLQPLADKMKAAFDARMNKLAAMPGNAKMHFIENYFPHFWKDPNAAQAGLNFSSKGVGKQGSAASLKARSVPTIADGIAMGLNPVTTDPIEATLRYISSMDHFIGAQETLEAGKAAGMVRYLKPKTMGASGHPDSFKVPDGWVAIQGRGAVNARGEQAYAPADWARVYNNFIDRGIHKNVEWGKVYDALQSTSNAVTSLELGLSGFHAFTMANEAIISDVAKGISELVGGRPIRAISSVAKAPLAPLTKYREGKKFEQVYLGRSAATPDYRRIVDLGTQAGMRAVGKSHAADYRYSAMGSYWTAFKRGALKMQMRESLANIRQAPITGTAKEAMRVIGRTMETVAQPLFEKYIPRIKNGAFYDTMKAWIEQHPQATREEQIAGARQIWDSIDNRFGELVQDNIFWDKTLKQVAQLGMRSYSWNLGTVREIGGGLKDIAGLAKGGEWSPRASYVVALPIVVGTVNAAYQYLRTGKSPESPEDLIAGRTGGTAPGFGGRGEVEERAMMPGYQKDVLGWYFDWKQEMANKVASGPRLAIEAVTGKDWKGDPIARPDATVPEWLGDYFKWASESIGPISVRQVAKGQKEGSELGLGSTLTGIRPAPAYLQDPEGYERGMSAIERKKWQGKQRRDLRQRMQYGGPQE